MTAVSRTMTSLFAWLYRAAGKQARPDPELPTTLLVSLLMRRAVWLVRGVTRFRRAVFVGPGVRVRGKARVSLGSMVTLDRGVEVDGYARHGVVIGDRVRLGAFTIISCTSHVSRLGAGVSIGRDSGIGEWGYIGATGGVTIGADVIMGQYVSFHAQEHEFDNLDVLTRHQGSTERGIVIEDNCWVGARVTFLDGAHVREGSVIAAGAVVRGDFPAFSVIGGIPARVLRDRRRA